LKPKYRNRGSRWWPVTRSLDLICEVGYGYGNVRRARWSLLVSVTAPQVARVLSGGEHICGRRLLTRKQARAIFDLIERKRKRERD
jgi:hypothetical protein